MLTSDPFQQWKWHTSTKFASVSLLHVCSVASDSSIWASHSWNWRKSTLGVCHRPTSTSTTATNETKSNDDIDFKRDFTQLTAWMIAPTHVPGGGVAVLFSSHAHESQIADALKKNNNLIPSQNRLSMSMWLQMRTKPAWGTLQLWIFLSCSINAAIDVLTRRVGL